MERYIYMLVNRWNYAVVETGNGCVADRNVRLSDFMVRYPAYDRKETTVREYKAG